jgi:IMP cyclohydrolase
VNHDPSFLSGYPGRGVGVRGGASGGIEWLYFLTGRSKPSRARRFEVTGDRLEVTPVSPGTQLDALRHYACAVPLRSNEGVVVGNGDHVERIATQLTGGRSLEEAVVELEPEPDPPIHTPRIAVVVTRARARGVRVYAADHAVTRDVFDISIGSNLVILTTYDGNIQTPVGSAPVSALHVPVEVDAANFIWDRLDPDLRVTLAAGTSPLSIPRVILPGTRGL